MVRLRWGKLLFKTSHNRLCVATLNMPASVFNSLCLCVCGCFNREAKGIQAFQDFLALQVTVVRKETG